MASTVRSLLFVPGHQGTRFDKACQSGADAIVLDLEDAVPLDRKDEARAQVALWLAGRAGGGAGPQLAIRVNGADTPWHADDLAVCANAGVDALMLPKSEDPAVLRAIAAKLPTVALLPLVETARGMARLEEIAAAPGVQRLVFGTIDFQADLDIEGDGLELLYFRSRMVLASRVAGIQPPVDGVSTSIDDPARVEADALQARRLGFGAKLCIHPKQVAMVNQGFSPTQAQVDWARHVIEADAASGGAPVAVDGKMVDRPVVLKAEALLRAAERR
ncbi:CoA ester lyase [Variovorax sp. YR216]|uniref:HpcH/HpaI aldolase/citrate lyase family protein n=1 Tax=Variovorax sp. YR216 TaxID=1882828 RepID=UPI00089B469B|nr:CoA ester lyase [Variovorax sp. YR216]SEA38447.1 citrate lyase subunit beta / citryl-CoA lyase [Variovorax sp. YR216]